MPAVNVIEAMRNLRRRIEAVAAGAEVEIINPRDGQPAVRLVVVRPPQSGKRIGVAKGQFVAPESIGANEADIAALFPTSRP